MKSTHYVKIFPKQEIFSLKIVTSVQTNVPFQNPVRLYDVGKSMNQGSYGHPVDTKCPVIYFLFAVTTARFRFGSLSLRQPIGSAAYRFGSLSVRHYSARHALRAAAYSTRHLVPAVCAKCHACPVLYSALTFTCLAGRLACYARRASHRFPKSHLLQSH
jgi:hypothetical protein